ncbi:unnamed protein product (macronuclear) [Paramecium tetraurelia]|uniref:Uncharacterized protein n=1 Tax=Paramecium tetraurelia TaxID=5888 RepID=A0DMB8_PARTE|nr:uncharacterized protein GSPATT00018403001 [Paramecium tetraurelia]CAK84185.1 unnamed protein product [Paramecium tetraurelia]|eukprot:XP_001451582.1 hypothetical protein (macronuclear) [Paramecium tetraurelia strain d4-2]
MLSFEAKLSKLNCNIHGLEILYVNIGQNATNKRALCKQCRCNDIQLHRNYLNEVLQEYIEKRRKDAIKLIQQLQFDFNRKYEQIMGLLDKIKEMFDSKLKEFTEKEYLSEFQERFFGWGNLTLKDVEDLGIMLSKDVEFVEDQVSIKEIEFKSEDLEEYVDVLSNVLDDLEELNINQEKLVKLDMTLPKYEREISQLDISKDEDMAAVVTLNSDIDIWNLQTMKKTVLKGHDDIVNTIVFSKYSNSLITGGREGTIKVWKCEGKWIIHDILIGHDDWITALAIGNQDQLIASASNQEILIWSYKQDHYAKVQKLLGHTDSIYSLGFLSQQEYLISGSFDKTVRLWEGKDKQQWNFKQQFYYHSDKVQSIACSNNKLFGSCSWDQSIRLYDQMTDDSYDCIQVLYGHQGKVYQIQFNDDSKILYSCSHDNTIKLWSQLQTNFWECFHEIKQDFHIKFIGIRQHRLISSNYYEIYVYKQEQIN